MKSLRRFRDYPISIPLSADDITEFHAARLLLLISLCGKKSRLDGLTKLAKLDFFIRYPEFFDRIKQTTDRSTKNNTIESKMVRHFYGPWDNRYYDVLAYMESRNLIAIEKSGARTYSFVLSSAGEEVVQKLLGSDAYAKLTLHIRDVAKELGGKTGNKLKEMIYREFDSEVARRELGEIIT